MLKEISLSFPPSSTPGVRLKQTKRPEAETSCAAKEYQKPMFASVKLRPRSETERIMPRPKSVGAHSKDAEFGTNILDDFIAISLLICSDAHTYSCTGVHALKKTGEEAKGLKADKERDEANANANDNDNDNSDNNHSSNSSASISDSLEQESSEEKEREERERQEKLKESMERVRRKKLESEKQRLLKELEKINSELVV